VLFSRAGKSKSRREQALVRTNHRRVVTIVAAAVVSAYAIAPAGLEAQLSRDSILHYVKPLVLVGGIPADAMRLEQLRTGAGLDGYLIRSASSLNAPLPGNKSVKVALIAPEFFATNNSALPFSINDGSVWAGVGTSSRTLAGFRVEAGPLRIIVAPEFLNIENKYFRLRDTVRFYAPPIIPERQGGGFVFPWYVAPYSIDLPLRMGAKPIHRIDAGQSTAMLTLRDASFGVSNENQWWGPGIRNALILSDNAAGFPHLFIRTARPWRNRLGSIEARLIVGGLTESKWFDTTQANNLRSLSAFAFTFRPNFEKNLVMGAARSVFATNKGGWPRIPGRLFDAFAATGRPNNRPLADSSLTPGGRDQIYSLFGRWVFPDDGFETYVEWARQEFPLSLRDLLVAPNHTQGYTLGLQWTRPTTWRDARVRLQGEVTTVEQSATFRDRPVGSFYTSRRVIQGYTQRGEPLAAAIGPGASSQWLAADYLEPHWSFGVFAGRIRWNEDIHSTYGFPIYQGYCVHDVSVFPGARATAGGRFGYISADVTYGNRLNAYFQEQSGCPLGNSVLDIRNRTIRLTLGTFTPGRSR
jgi:Capsule assembly protein Wzi